jgi:adenine-specific DNA-methyltransferase
MLIATQHTTNNDIENEYTLLTSLVHRKKYAQFFTPFVIADLMVKWIVENPNLKTVLEPAFGLGVFSRALLSCSNDLIIKGFDVDSSIFETAKGIFEDDRNVSIELQDYMFNDWDNKYDGIVCNPPYFKFHDYDNKIILKELENRMGCKLNGFTNLYTLFLLKSIYQLNKNGRAAYIIPSEFLNSDYGKLVKNYLIKSKVLRHIVVIDFEENVFDDALTTASILLMANDNQLDKVQFTTINSVKHFDIIEKWIKAYPNVPNDEQTIKFENLNPDIKWRAYYQAQNAIKYKNLVPFSNYGKVVRGIATGSNEYFIFNQSKAISFQIDHKSLLPCICRAVDVKNSFFSQSDYQELKDNDKSVFLFDAINANDENSKKYIQLGEYQEVHKKFLTASRNPWYSLENRPPAPIWVSVFNRNGLRFIRNEANISNLTTFHCIYPLKKDLFSDTNIDLLFAYLLTNVARTIFEDNRREYGNGLQKFEPNDINKSLMLDIGILDKTTQNQILDNYYLYRKSVLDNCVNESYLSRINQLFVEQFS